MNYFVIYVFFMNIMCLVMIRKHILLCLMSFEFIIISLLLMILSYCILFTNSFYIYLIMMTFYVCESVMGLSVLVRMIRSHGNDYLNSMFMW